VDAVYHVALAELRRAVDTVGGAEQRDILDEIAGQRRLFDFDELVDTLIV
jgi:hypothetical protein